MTEHLSKDEEFILSRLKEIHSTTSWDWPEDLCFAEYLGEHHLSQEIRTVMNSDSVFAHKIGAWKMIWDKDITKRRMAVLKKLKERNITDSFWQGLGAGAMNQFGTKRVLGYSLTLE